MQDVAGRVANRVQLTTDGTRLTWIPWKARSARLWTTNMLTKHYGATVYALGRYSPGDSTGNDLRRVKCRSDLAHVSMFYAERQNFIMRMSMRRFTRLTNAFSKKADNHAHIIALYTTWSKFARQHKALRCNPAMAAGLSSTLWSMADVVALIDAAAEPANACGTYKPRATKAAISN